MQLFGRPLLAVLCGIALASPAALAATGAPGVPAYHIVRESRPDMTRYAELLKMRIGLCALAAQGQGKPKPQVALPAAALLAQHAGIREEQWFDGVRYAEFSTNAFLEPDLDRDCQLALRYEFSASVQPGPCRPGVQGAAAGGVVQSSAPPSRAPSVSRDEPMSPEVAEVCAMPRRGKARKLQDPAKLAKQPTASGVACVWEDELLGHEYSQEQKEHSRVCLHAVTPFYPVPSGRMQRRKVELKHVGRNLAVQPELALTTAEINGGVGIEAVSVRVLDKAPDAVFSEAAVEKHIRQPLWAKWPHKP